MTVLLSSTMELSITENQRLGEGRCELETLGEVARLGEILPHVLRRYALWGAPLADELNWRGAIFEADHER